MNTTLSCCLLAVAAGGSLLGQSAALVTTADIPLFGTPRPLSWTLGAPPGSTYALLLDFASGPTDVLGERFYLSAPFTQAIGQMPSLGSVTGQLNVPRSAVLIGSVIHAQGCALTPTAPNGVFVVSNASSTALHAGAIAVVHTFATTSGFTGSFRSDVDGQIRGGAVRRRTAATIDPQGVPWNQPLATPLHASGGRVQMVFRDIDVGATGEPELLTAIRWKPFSASLVQPNAFQQLELRVGHTAVEPDYTHDPWSALPMFPQSGLSTTFANNHLPGAPPQTVYQGPYAFGPSQLTANGHLPFPVIAPFAYDGVSSLLIDVLVPQDVNATTGPGFAVRLMSLSSPQPNARVWAGSLPTAPWVIPNPAQLVSGRGDNAMYELELDFVRLETEAISPWLSAGPANPDYGPAVVAYTQPPGTSLRIAYRGASSAAGANATAWALTANVADGLPFVQFRLTFGANEQTGEVPLVDTIAIPVQ